jgi:O-succinylbenzoate synthase
VNVEAVERRIVRLPLVRPFVTSQSTTTARDVLLVRVISDGVEGWGECPADSSDVTAVEMATLDAQLRIEGLSLAQHLGGVRTAIDSTATVGLEDDINDFLAAGYRSVKLKVAPDRLPREVPTGVAVQVDANGSFADRAEQLDGLDELGLILIEQPLAPADLRGHAALTRRLRTPVCLDESIGSLDELDNAISTAACRAVCIKSSRLGGLAAARVIHDRCVQAGMAAKVGGVLETGIGRAAALALASLPGFTLPADLSASDRYWEQDVTPPFELDADGRLPVPTGPGLGVDIRMDVVERYTVSVEIVRLD